MAAPFSWTTRALRTDSDRFSSPGLMFGGLIVCLWLYWLFTATVYSYVSSEHVQVLRAPQPVWAVPHSFGGSRSVQPYTQYTIKAVFPAADIARIRPEQPVSIQLLDSSSSLPLLSLKASVTKVLPAEGRIEVHLSQSAHDPLQTVNDLSLLRVRLDVAVASYTPFQFLLNTVIRHNSHPPGTGR